MERKGARRLEVLQRFERAGGLRPGVSKEIEVATGVPEAEAYGAGTFYHLLARPGDGVRVCRGLSCWLAGCDRRLEEHRDSGVEATPVSCLGRCDLAPAEWDPQGDPATPAAPVVESREDLAIDLAAPDDDSYEGLGRVLGLGSAWFLEELETSGLRGRGGAGFPVWRKWQAVRQQPETDRIVVLNADEGEPGTFKDREILLRRPHRVVEGLSIAAHCLEAKSIYAYVRGEFAHARDALRRAVEAAQKAGTTPADLDWHFVDGHGAYVCGEETALLESIEGRRGLPRLRPPYPVEVGLWGRPTLVQNVETFACIPALARRGGEWFRALGKTDAGTKLYSLSGRIEQPGVYEAPMGATLRELLELAGGVRGRLLAFSPGGASSGFLPASMIDLPLDFAALAEAGSMLGSAGVVILDDTVDLVEAARVQAAFFEEESCGQCAPCRIGTRMIRRALDHYLESGDPETLAHLSEVAWGMEEASICGLGQTAPLPLLSVARHWPERLGLDAGTWGDRG